MFMMTMRDRVCCASYAQIDGPSSHFRSSLRMRTDTLLENVLRNQFSSIFPEICSEAPYPQKFALDRRGTFPEKIFILYNGLLFLFENSYQMASQLMRAVSYVLYYLYADFFIYILILYFLNSIFT